MVKPFECPQQHRVGLEEVKHAVSIHHSFLDSWIYLFFENKKFNVKETVEKLNRRDIMEKSMFSAYTLSPAIKSSMRSGIVQYVGRDYEGRPVLYFNTCRDFPKVEERDSRRENMDMFLSWAVRCSRENPSSKVIWLINQKDSSFRKNMDLIFQKDMALRVSKFFPGVVAKMYLCNMSSALTLVFRPLLRQLPSSISDCIFFFSGNDLAKGKLLEFIPEEVLPIAMGGKNNCDHPGNYELFAQSVESYFIRCINALHSGISIKEMEMMEEYGVDRQGQPLSPKTIGNESNGPENTSSHGMHPSKNTKSRSSRNATPGTPVAGYPSINSDIRFMEYSSHASINALPEDRPQQQASRCLPLANREAEEEGIDSASEGIRSSALGTPQNNGLSNPGQQNSNAPYAPLGMSSGSPLARIGNEKGPVERIRLPIPNFKALSDFPFKVLPNLKGSTREKVSALLRELCFYGEKLGFMLNDIMLSLRDGHFRNESDGARVTTMELLLRQNSEMFAHVAHSLFCLFPPTCARLNYPIFAWLIDPVLERKTISQLSLEWWGEASLLDCTSPDNLLLSLQSFAVEYIDDCDTLIQENLTAQSLLTRLGNFWPSNLTYREVIGLLDERCRASWRMLVPHFQQYIECKVALAIVEFIRFHGLLVSGGRIDVNAEWYQKLLWAMIQYREMHRRTYIFHVFPPLFRDQQPTLLVAQGCVSSSKEKGKMETENTKMKSDGSATSSPPSPTELLNLRGLSVCFQNIVRVICLVERSVENTLHQLASPVTVNIAAHTVVERYLENTMSRISISYESQRNGLTPPELASQKQREAYQCLEAAQVPLTEYLFSLTAITWINEHVQHFPSKYHSWADMMRQLQSELQDARTCVRIRQSSRLIANGLAAEAYNMQGSFGCSAFSSDLRTDEPPEGYAAALSLLFIAAAASQSMVSKISAATPSHSAYASTDLTEITASDANPNDKVPDVKEFIKVVQNIQKCTSSLLGEVAT